MSYVAPAHLVAASMPAFPMPPGVTAHVIPQAPPSLPPQHHLQQHMQLSGQGLPMLPNAPLPPSMLGGDVKPNKRKKNYAKQHTTAVSSSSTSAAALQVNRSASATNGRPPPALPSGSGGEDVKLDTLFAVKDKCEFCDYVCDKRDRMRRHVRSMHYNYKPFACDQCPFTTGRKDKLKRHTECVHCDVKPYKCEFCTHRSGRKDKIKEHEQSVHYGIKGRPKKKYKKKTKAEKDCAAAAAQVVHALVTGHAQPLPPVPPATAAAPAPQHLVLKPESQENFVVVNLPDFT